MIKALVGLGNPGKEYEKTYHNVGVFVAQQMARIAAADPENSKELLLYVPQTFMNVSGPAVAGWMKMNNLTVDDVVVVHDETDLVRGSFKLVRDSGSAGHKGVESIMASLKTKLIGRLRVGVRDPQEQVRKKAGDFVLTQWSAQDEQLFKTVADESWQLLKRQK